MEMFKNENKSNLKRLNEILKVLSKYEFDFISEKIGLKNKIPFINRSYKYNSLQEIDETIPSRLRMGLQELGPTYIKLGQMLSTRPDLVGDDIALEFSKMQYKNPVVDFDIIKNTVEEELQCPIGDVFESFDKVPISSASIGEVHKAVIKEGSCGAVKVQKPNLEEIIKSDLPIMKFLAKRINQYIPQSRSYNLPIILAEFERSILKEIDYIQEFQNMC